jgi:3-deoxy-D-manno-octulosonic acid kinase
VKGALSLSRAGRAWRMAHALERAGVATPRAVAVTGTGWWPARRPSFLVTEEIPGAVTLDAWRGPRIEAARRLGELVARLHAGGFSHPDLNAGNLVLDPAGRPWLVDLDTARRLGPTSRLRAVGRFHAVGDLARLARRVAVFPGITRTDRLRFLQRYAEVNGDGDWRRWWRLVALRAEAAQARRARRTARA